MTKIQDRKEFKDGAIDLLVGGTPCQSFSVAGLRKGLADPRGNLALVFLSLLDRKRPRWVVWENVPGVLSSWTDGEVNPSTEGLEDVRGEAERLGRIIGPAFADLGADFGAGPFEEARQTSDFDAFTSGLRELGYGLAWRVLDAQYFGVPQRRQRVFVVGYLGDWRPAAEVLFEPHGLQGHLAPRRRSGKEAPAASGGGARGGGAGPDVAHTLRGEGFDASEDGTGRGTPLVEAPRSHWEGGPHPTLNQSAKSSGGIGASNQEIFSQGGGGLVPHPADEVSHALNAKGGSGRHDPSAETFVATPPPVLITMREGKEGGGKGPLIQEDRSAALATGNNQVLITPSNEPIPLDMRQASRGATMTNNRAPGSSGGAPGTGIGEAGDPAPTVAASHTPAVCIPAPEPIPILEAGARTGKSTTDTRAGLGVGDEGDPMFTLQSGKQHAVYDMRGRGNGDTVPTLCSDHPSRPSDYCPMVFEARVARNGRGAPDDVCPPLKAESGETGKGDGAPLVFDPNQVTNKDNRSQPKPGGPCHTLPNQSQPPMLAFNVYPKSGQGAKLEASETEVANAVSPTQGEKMTDRGTRLASTAAVRRLTPRECERLQGFPDDYTRVATFVVRHKRTCPKMADVEWDEQDDSIIDLRVDVVAPTDEKTAECGCDIRKTEAEDCPDGPRYKACGNSMAVPVMNWIGTRIQEFEDSVRENTK
jgi:site-specific DNA-cytosine methylase